MRKITLEELKALAVDAQGSIDHIYLHWSGGHYGQFYADYHVNIDSDGTIYVSTDDLTEVKAHTWRRNTGSIGVSLACCAFATSKNLGTEPPTTAQIECIAQVIATLCIHLDLPCDAMYVMTHGEAGDNIDGGTAYTPYGQNTTCERWDLARLSNGDPWGSGGDILRGKANFYINQGGL